MTACALLSSGAVGVGATAADWQAGVPVRPSAAQVAGPTVPVTGSFAFDCAALTAASVIGPNSPSGVVPTRRCNTATAGPIAPRPRLAHVAATPEPHACWPHAASVTRA